MHTKALTNRGYANYSALLCSVLVACLLESLIICVQRAHPCVYVCILMIIILSMISTCTYVSVHITYVYL